MEAGKVCTGFSRPYVAKYNNAGGTVTYSGGMRLARGVSVKLNVDTPSENNFYADNVVAESENGIFQGGNVALTVDGLHNEAEAFIYGLAAPEEVAYGDNKTTKVYKHSANAQPPYLGIGVIVEYTSGGTTTYVPVVFRKGKFRASGLDAKTREKNPDWQTQELTADLHRDDTAAKDWRWFGEDLDSEEEAETVLKALLNVSGEA